MEPGYFLGKKLFESIWIKGLKQHFFSYKTSENLIQFKSLMKNWNGNLCSCTVCTK